MRLFHRFSIFLLPSVVQIGLSFLMLPVTTYILGPKDFGSVALITALSAFGMNLATMGSTFILASKYPVINSSQKSDLISTLIGMGFALSVSFSLALCFLWKVASNYWYNLLAFPFLGLVISLIAAILTVPWIIAIDVITLEGKAHLYALSVISQSLAYAIAVVISLYLFRFGLLSLLVGNAASAFVSLISAILVFKERFRLLIHRYWVKEIFKFSTVTTLGGIMENLQTITERYMLSSFVGLHQLGIYTHSQSYKSVMSAAIKAVTRTMLPVTLSESRDTQSDFYITRKTWNSVYLMIIIAGIFIALFGKSIISVLTHGKFSEAYVFVALWTIVIIIQSSGKPETGILYTNEKGILYGKLLILSMLAGIFFIITLVPLIKTMGALIALMLQQLIFRASIQYHSRKIYKTGFADWAVVFGSITILSTLISSRYFKLEGAGAWALFLILLTPALFLLHKYTGIGLSRMMKVFK